MLPPGARGRGGSPARELRERLPQRLVQRVHGHRRGERLRHTPPRMSGGWWCAPRGTPRRCEGRARWSTRHRSSLPYVLPPPTPRAGDGERTGATRCLPCRGRIVDATVRTARGDQWGLSCAYAHHETRGSSAYLGAGGGRDPTRTTAQEARQHRKGISEISIGTALLLVCPCASSLCREGRPPPGSPATVSRRCGT